MTQQIDILETLQKDHGFKIEKSKDNPEVSFFKFNDGREYRFVEPSFMLLHDALTEDGNVEVNLFELGLKQLSPNKEGTPKIDHKYLDSHKTEGILLWSRLLRRLLSRPST